MKISRRIKVEHKMHEDKEQKSVLLSFYFVVEEVRFFVLYAFKMRSPCPFLSLLLYKDWHLRGLV